MKKWLIAVVGVVLLAGCGQGGTAQPGAEATVPVVREAEDRVLAEGVVEPARWSELLFTAGGTVAEVPVAEGDAVAEGDLLVQLDPIDAQLAVQEAQARLAGAQAELARLQAGPRGEEVAEAEAALQEAQGALAQAAARRDELAAGVTEAEARAAQAQVAEAEAAQRTALRQRDQAYEQKDEEVREQADYALYAAEQALAAAQARLAAAQGGGEARLQEVRAGVWTAAAQRDVAQAELALLQAGATPEEVAERRAAVEQAQVGLAQAEAALARTQLRAPFAGTVTRVDVEVGETVAPGEVVVVLAVLKGLEVRTTDLTELDVARVAEGQGAVVKVDGLPGVELRGHVSRIGLRSVDYRGDVTYPVTVALDESAPELRWGMTALVEIDVD